MSTIVLQVLHTLEKWMEGLDNGDVVNCIYFDLIFAKPCHGVSYPFAGKTEGSPALLNLLYSVFGLFWKTVHNRLGWLYMY